MKEILEKHWHHLEEGDVVDFLETAADKGLDTFEVGHRHEQFGPNTITQKKSKSSLILFLLFSIHFLLQFAQNLKQFFSLLHLLQK